MDLQPDARNKYFDPYLKAWTIKILPGEYHVCDEEELVVTTLGSCISACIRDVKANIGGMNHFMLPSSSNGEWAGTGASARYGNFAMEHLINEILKRGGSRDNLEARIFGGGLMMGDGSIKVGENNASFAKEYLITEKIRLLDEDLGGPYSRKVYFQPCTGKVMLKKLTVLRNDTIQEREKAYSRALSKSKIESEVELF